MTDNMKLWQQAWDFQALSVSECSDDAIHAWMPSLDSGSTVVDRVGDEDMSLDTDWMSLVGHLQFSPTVFDETENAINIDATMFPGTSNRSLSFWLRLDELDLFQFVFNQGSRSSGGLDIAISMSSGYENKLYFEDSTGWVETTDPLEANIWYHVCLTRNGTTISLYLDGVLQGTHTTSSTYADNTTWIGRYYTEWWSDRPGEPYHHLHGGLDNIRLYDRALSIEEIVNLATNRESTICSVEDDDGDYGYGYGYETDCSQMPVPVVAIVPSADHANVNSENVTDFSRDIQLEWTSCD